MRNVFRRPIRSDTTPPMSLPEVMPMKYQNRMVALSVGFSPHDWDRAGADKTEVPVVELFEEMTSRLDDQTENSSEPGCL